MILGVYVVYIQRVLVVFVTTVPGEVCRRSRGVFY